MSDEYEITVQQTIAARHWRWYWTVRYRGYIIADHVSMSQGGARRAAERAARKHDRRKPNPSQRETWTYTP